MELHALYPSRSKLRGITFKINIKYVFYVIIYGNRYLVIGRLFSSESETINHEAVLAALSYCKEDAKSMREIAEVMDLEMTSYIDWIRAERGLARSLRALIKWGWVACDRRQRENGHKFWYNAYWKTELAEMVESDTSE